ncbi:LacI family transcriptional regulator [Streptomyces sp. NBC_00075]|uniref:LacI family DNA-binding transcriptional regulator n=1 Tax=Streptomyces sp. NBC_00075 TaxID=2975641 RepID=UPI0032490EBD
MTRNLSAMPTLAQIARLAGVSVPTASRVVNGRENVAPATRLRVEEVIRRTGYARRPRADEAGAQPLVDVLVPNLDSPWCGEILRGVEEAASETGLGMVLSGRLRLNRSGSPGGGWFDGHRARGTSGVLFVHAELTPTQHLWMSRRRIPSVMVAPSAEPPRGMPVVTAANRSGGGSAAEHLLALGHRRIAVIGGPQRLLCSTQRLAGFRAALDAGGVRHRGEYVRRITLKPGSTEQVTEELLDLPEPPTAVFVCADEMAVDVMRVAARRGLRVPRDLSVVGFDDIPGARWTTPELTTVHQPIAEMAAVGMRALADVMYGRPPATQHTVLPTRLVIRATTAPPPRLPSH